MTIRDLSNAAMAPQAVGHLTLADRSTSDVSLAPYKAYLNPNNGRQVAPYRTYLMGHPDAGGPGVPFLAYVPKTALMLEASETKVLNLDAAVLQWYQNTALAAFASLPSGDRDLAFTLQLEESAQTKDVVSNTVVIRIE